MLVIVLENAPARLRGVLSLWLLEIRAGVYIGRASARHRHRIWARVKRTIDADQHGNAVMAWSTPSEARFEFETHGENRRMPTNFDGLPLVRFDAPSDLVEQEEMEMAEWMSQMQNAEVPSLFGFDSEE